MTVLHTVPSLPLDTVDQTTPYVNRELSWLRFNERVLEEALDATNPLLERLRFLTIFHTNLDEFFMIRVSGLKKQIVAGVDVVSPDGLSPRSQLARLGDAIAPVLDRAQRCLHDQLLPALHAVGVQIIDYRDLSDDERAHWNQLYLERVHPILTPLAVGPTHPFPFISNLSLNIAVIVESPDGEQRLARVKVPRQNLPRLIPLRADRSLVAPVRLLPMEQLIGANLHHLFRGMKLSQPWAFRITRDADMEIAEDEADDLLKVLQEELRKRRFGDAVRLEVQAGMPPEIRTALVENLSLHRRDVFEVDGLLRVADFSEILSIDLPELKYKPYVPARSTAFGPSSDPFAAIRAGDIMLHHPFDAFTPVVDFIRAAARDPRVVTIKQTLYRTSGNSPIIRALERAVENGKQVAAVVELKARFDEQNNIAWARRLEEVGVHVVYGVPHLKTHAKLALVIRREDGGQLFRYAHVGTGNYNTITARVYTDLGLLTCDPRITSDVAEVFNQLTGFAEPGGYRELLVAPRHMKGPLLERIQRETANAVAGFPARIIFKCNAIVDPEITAALYVAGRAGVRVDLLVRGICGVLPQAAGTGDNIQVRSVVGRFLEHSRVYWFHNNDAPEAWIGSADLMVRNLERRVEVLTPIKDPKHASWVRDVLLERYLTDRRRTRVMLPDGTYTPLVTAPAGPVEPSAPEALTELDVHQQFMRDGV